MIDLEKYGFKQTISGEKFTEYEGHGFRIVFFNYPYTTGSGQELNRQSFVINTKYTTSRAYTPEEMQQWLVEHKIKKQ